MTPAQLKRSIEILRRQDMHSIMPVFSTALCLPLVVVAQDDVEVEGKLADNVHGLAPEELERFLRKLEKQGFAKMPTAGRRPDR